jgi:hypothetical protein
MRKRSDTDRHDKGNSNSQNVGGSRSAIEVAPEGSARGRRAKEWRSPCRFIQNSRALDTVQYVRRLSEPPVDHTYSDMLIM